MELEVIRDKSMQEVEFNKTITCDPVTILQAKEESTRNLIICSAAYEVVQNLSSTRDQKIAEESIRMKPDSSSGLYVTGVLRKKY
eukprot:2126714-Ditylum_brightwellii.AAC.1